VACSTIVRPDEDQHSLLKKWTTVLNKHYIQMSNDVAYTKKRDLLNIGIDGQEPRPTKTRMLL
jgi:hypothetical protein